MAWEKFFRKRQESQSSSRLDRLISSRPPEGSEAAAQEKLKIELLARVAPDAARIFEELQDPAMPAQEFVERLRRFNERPRKDKDGNPTGVWRADIQGRGEKFHTLTRRILAGRSVTAHFTDDGKADVIGRDDDYEKAFWDDIHGRSRPFWKRWRGK